jgi:hypothetical protein
MPTGFLGQNKKTKEKCLLFFKACPESRHLNSRKIGYFIVEESPGSEDGNTCSSGWV